MAEHIILDILTPRGPKRADVSVPGAEVPGLLGEIGVLPGHETFVTAVTPGVVRFKADGESVRMAVGAGFMEVTSERVVVLVERAAEVDEIDAADAGAKLIEVTRDLEACKAAVTSAEYRKLSQEQAWLDAQVRAAGGQA